MSKPFSELTKNFSQERKDRVKAITQQLIDDMPTEVRDIKLVRKDKLLSEEVIPLNITQDDVTVMYDYNTLMLGNTKPLDKDTMDRIDKIIDNLKTHMEGLNERARNRE